MNKIVFENTYGFVSETETDYEIFIKGATCATRKGVSSKKLGLKQALRWLEWHGKRDIFTASQMV